MKPTDNQTFSLQRMGNYLNLYVATWWKTLASLMGGLMVAYLFMSLFLTTVSGSMYSPERYYRQFSGVDPFWEIEMVMAVLMGFVFAVMTGGMLFISMRDPKNRLAALTLPASVTEKFCTVFLIYIIGGAVVYLVSAFLADLVHYAAASALFETPERIHMLPWYNPFLLAHRAGLDMNAVTVFVTTILVTQSFFALGSIVWYRNSIIKTAVFLYGLQCACVVLPIIMIYIMKARHFMPDGQRMAQLDFEPTTSGICLFVAAVGAVICVVNYLLTYLRFRESDYNFRW